MLDNNSVYIYRYLDLQFEDAFSSITKNPYISNSCLSDPLNLGALNLRRVMSKLTNGAVDDISLSALASNIKHQTDSIVQYLQQNGYAAPTFATDSSEIPETPEYQAIHRSLKTSLEDLERLVDGPRKHLRSFACVGSDLAAYQVALEFDLFTIVPAEGLD